VLTHATIIIVIPRRASTCRAGNGKALTMPKNQFQRPTPVVRDHKVPRHGAPVPGPKPGSKQALPAKPAPAAMPPLDVLLGKTRH
jgi:hypothetical protein